jgi:hypothetical protein
MRGNTLCGGKKRAAGWRAFSLWGREERQRREEKKGEAFDRKNPPFANGAKGGAPSSSFGGGGFREIQEHSPFGFAQGRQEWLCHRKLAGWDRMLGVFCCEKIEIERGGTLWV